MKHPVIGYFTGALAAVFLLAQAAQAQDPAPGLQDLVGAKGSSGEQTLQKRGYQFIKGEKSGGASYTNWRHTRTGQCVIVQTADGRYQSLVKAPEADCQVNSASDSVPAPGGSGKTVVHYPDQNITLNWRGGKRVNVTFEDMKVQPATFSTSEGNTQFVFEGKTYFYTSDPGAAEMEVKHFRDGQ